MTSPTRALMTSATMTVTLSGPPPRRASSTSRSAASCTSGMRRASLMVSVGDHVGQPVGAEQIAIAPPRLPDRDVRFDLRAQQRAQDHRLAWVVLRLVGAELAGVDEVLDVGVVVGDLRQHVAAQQVGAGVADVHQADLRADEPQCGERGAHALELAVLLHGVGYAVVGVHDGVAQRTHEVVDAAVLVERFERADDDLAGDLAGGVTAHAVGDREQPRAGVDRVLVVVADEALVRAHRVAQVEGHGYVTAVTGVWLALCLPQAAVIAVPARSCRCAAAHRAPAPPGRRACAARGRCRWWSRDPPRPTSRPAG